MIALMKFKPYFFGLTIAQRKELAIFAGTSVGHLTNFAYGYTVLAPAQCSFVEAFSNKKVTRPELHKNWKAIWPELVKSKAKV